MTTPTRVGNDNAVDYAPDAWTWKTLKKANKTYEDHISDSEEPQFSDPDFEGGKLYRESDAPPQKPANKNFRK